MNEIPVPQTASPSQPQSQLQLCPQCHLPQPTEFYFCPNCGAKLSTPPLSTTTGSQILLYLFSAVLPWIAYLAITKWEGVKYMRSPDSQTRAIGYIALGILVVSSVIAFWLAAVWINQTINSVTSGINDPNSLLNGSGL
jgi:uncharacterized paraquat-inducible protein A